MTCYLNIGGNIYFQNNENADIPKICSLECGPDTNCRSDTCCAPKTKNELARKSSKDNSPTRRSPDINKLKVSASSPCFEKTDRD